MLENFQLAKIRFNLKAQENGLLPKYKGSVLRGGFGYVFRNIVCLHKQADCQDCPLQDSCAYAYIFNTSSTPKSKKYSQYSDVPRPFIVDLSDQKERQFAPGDTLQFGLILIGKAIEYFPYFIFCFDELSRKGLGRDRIKFSLQEVSGFDFLQQQYQCIFEPKSRLIKDNLPTITADKLSFQPKDSKLSLKFLTPTRIKYRGKYITNMEFHMMIRNLLRRISMLMFFHCQTELKIDYDKLITQAKMVKVYDWDLNWHDWSRYSSKQDTRIKLGGFIGNITYTGNFDNLMSFIALGEQIHLGKNTTFGLGKYRICNGK